MSFTPVQLSFYTEHSLHVILKTHSRRIATTSLRIEPDNCKHDTTAPTNSFTGSLFFYDCRWESGKSRCCNLSGNESLSRLKIFQFRSFSKVPLSLWVARFIHGIYFSYQLNKTAKIRFRPHFYVPGLRTVLSEAVAFQVRNSIEWNTRMLGCRKETYGIQSGRGHVSLNVRVSHQQK